MDHSKVHHVSLCAGYGGIDLGLRRAIPRLRTIAYSEIEGYACANLVAKIEAGLLDPAPIWTDVKSFPYRQFHGCVHILSGGYPCQPFSAAGKRLGRNDPRHLWPWIADGIALMRPSLCFFENVEGHITLGLRDVLNDLGELGYRTTWGIFSAAEVGAPHQRKRVFILAHKLGSGLEGLLHDITAQGREDERGPATGCSQHRGDAWPSRPGEEQFGWEPPRVVGDTAGKGSLPTAQQGIHNGEEGTGARDEKPERRGDIVGNSESGTRFSDAQRETGHAAQSDEELADTSIIGCDGRTDGTSGRSWEPREASEDTARCGGESNGMRQTEPPLGGDADGAAGGMDYAELCISGDNRTDELRLLGNGVVPATAALAFKTLLKELI